MATFEMLRQAHTLLAPYGEVEIGVYDAGILYIAIKGEEPEFDESVIAVMQMHGWSYQQETWSGDPGSFFTYWELGLSD